MPTLRELLQSLAPTSPLLHILTRCPTLENRELFLSQPDVAQLGPRAAASAQQVRVAELLRPLLHKAGVDTTVPMGIIGARSTHCGQGATSASVTALVGSLVEWVQAALVQAALRDAFDGRTPVQIQMLGSAAYHALLRELLWCHGIRVQAAASVALQLEGKTSTASREQWAGVSWALPISENYMHGLNGKDGYFNLREVVAHHARKEPARRDMLGLMLEWRRRADDVVAALGIEQGEAAVVHAVLDELAVSDSDPGFASQASSGLEDGRFWPARHSATVVVPRPRPPFAPSIAF